MSTQTIERSAKTKQSFVPVGHYAHPDDSSTRTALCGQPILGVPADGVEHEVCLHCVILWATQDWSPLPGH